MADTYKSVGPAGLREKLHDNGDGTYSPAVNASVTVSGASKGTPVSSLVAVGATSTLLLAANVTRVKATFANLDASGTTVYLKGAAGATTNDYPMPYGTEYTDDSGATIWYAISATGSVNINVVEYS